MPNHSKCLLVGSVEDHCGKSAMVLALAQRLGDLGQRIAYGKPLGTCLDLPFSAAGASCSAQMDEDVRFLSETLKLSPEQLQPTLLMLDQPRLEQRLAGQEQTDYCAALGRYGEGVQSDVLLVEGPGTLTEGLFFQLSLAEMAEALGASILLVARYKDLTSLDPILAAQQKFGDRLLGILFNDVPETELAFVQAQVKPFLQGQGIDVFGLVPHMDLLRSVSVAELVQRLDAQVLCAQDHLDLMVENLCIGAMNVNSALEYFRRGHNMAVVTGGDRADLQLAALETSTQCLILTGRVQPREDIVARAEELEIPMISVDFDTLTTVERVEQAFGQVRFHEAIKAECILQMNPGYLEVDRLAEALGLAIAA